MSKMLIRKVSLKMLRGVLWKFYLSKLLLILNSFSSRISGTTLGLRVKACEAGVGLGLVLNIAFRKAMVTINFDLVITTFFVNFKPIRSSLGVK